MRGHIPFTIDEFKGLWSRGNPDSCPENHGIVVTNAQFGQSSVRSRQLWARFSEEGSASYLRRMFVYNTGTGTGYSFLIYATNSGVISTQKLLPTQAAPLGWVFVGNDADIDVTTFAGRCYIASSIYHGYYGKSLYVFDGTTLRLAGGDPPPPGVYTATGSSLANSLVTMGNRYHGISFETNTGFITKPVTCSPAPLYLPLSNTYQIYFTNLPIGPPGTVARRLIATKAIPGVFLPPDGLAHFPSYFIPGGRIADNTTTQAAMNYSDQMLLDDASYLQDIYDHPPGGSCITTFHNRLVIGAIGGGFADEHKINKIIVSRVNDPETFEMADGTIVVDPSSDVMIQAENTESLHVGITDIQEYRDTLYAWKLGSTYGIVDNGLEPSTWPIACLDQAMGAFRSGVVTILDSGGISIEYIMVANKAGLFTFNGLYGYPEISWKIRNTWESIVKIPKTISNPDFSNQGTVHFIADPINRSLYCLVGTYGPDTHEPTVILYCDFSETNITDENYYMNVKWSAWNDDHGVQISGIAAFDVGQKTRILTIGDNGMIQELGGAHPIREVPQNNFCMITSNLIRDPNEARVLHIGGYTLRAIGNGVSDVSLYARIAEPVDNSGAGFIKLIDLAPYIVTATNAKDKTILTNFSAQQMFFYLNGKEFNIDRVNIWMKPVYRTIPG